LFRHAFGGFGRITAVTTSVDPRTDLVRRAVDEVQRVIVGQHGMVERLMVALLARGHCLLEGVPGVAKTLAVRSFATVCGGSFARLQFTPDLVPSDIVGTRIYRQSTAGFEVELGPVFVQFVLADEVNRAPAKVQSAMLELMAEHQVSIGGVSYPVPRPFTVVATQNPVESEGVFSLPEAQRDRFLLKVDVGFPTAGEEAQILARMSVDPPVAEPVLTPDDVLALQACADRVFVHPLVADYAVRLVVATRETGPAHLRAVPATSAVAVGASPRATLGLVAGARALALIRGRDYVLPADLAELAGDVIGHRLLLGFDALADGVDPRAVVADVVAGVPPPRPVWPAGAGGSAPARGSEPADAPAGARRAGGGDPVISPQSELRWEDGPDAEPMGRGR
jgi:MoxR-like ATPase